MPSSPADSPPKLPHLTRYVLSAIVIVLYVLAELALHEDDHALKKICDLMVDLGRAPTAAEQKISDICHELKDNP
jgi:hypothetical protein